MTILDSNILDIADTKANSYLHKVESVVENIYNYSVEYRYTKRKPSELSFDYFFKIGEVYLQRDRKISQSYDITVTYDMSEQGVKSRIKRFICDLYKDFSSYFDDNPSLLDFDIIFKPKTI